MDSYCVKCKKKTAWKAKPVKSKTKNNRNMLKGKCAVCNKTKVSFVK